MTGHLGIFAGGDMVPAERTVTVAIGHGKEAARNIDAWLRRDSYHGAGANLKPAGRRYAGLIRRPVILDGTIRTNSSRGPGAQASTPALRAASRSAAVT